MKELTMTERGALARQAGIRLSATSIEQRNNALEAIAAALDIQRDQIISANQKDLERSKNENLSAPLLKRLTFDNQKINDVIRGLQELVTLPDPLNKTQMATVLDDGLELYRVTCPLGVVGIVFESRPDAFVQISPSELRSGNISGNHLLDYTFGDSLLFLLPQVADGIIFLQ